MKIVYALALFGAMLPTDWNHGPHWEIHHVVDTLCAAVMGACLAKGGERE